MLKMNNLTLDSFMKWFYCLSAVMLFSFLGCKKSTEAVIDYKSIIPINSDSTVNMVIEIPSGTSAKYEMNKQSHQLVIDSIDGQPRYINYLGYPGNYGMIPNTILPKDKGGDGDPLDIILLGSAVKRGSVQKVKIIGVLELLDNGEQDDKLVAINPSSKWSRVNDIDDLDTFYPGSKTIIATFFQNYKGKGEMELKGWSDRSKAQEILKKSIQVSAN